jgi:hypothetical protein
MLLKHLHKLPKPTKAVEKRLHPALFLLMQEALSVGMLAASTAWPDFDQRVKEKDVRFVMNTKEGGPEGWFTIHGGKVSLRLKSDKPADFTLTWKTAEVGWRAMWAMAAGDPKALQKAVMAGDLGLAGDAGSIGWFMSVLNLMAKCFRKRGKEGAMTVLLKVPGGASALQPAMRVPAALAVLRGKSVR